MIFGCQQLTYSGPNQDPSNLTQGFLWSLCSASSQLAQGHLFIYFYNQGCCPLPLFLVSMCCLIFSRLLCMLSSDVFRGLIKLLLVVLLTCIKFLGGPSFFWSQARTAHLAKDRESCWMAASSAWWWLGAHFSPPSDVHRKEMLCMTRSQEWHQEGEHAGSYQRWKLYRVGHTA